MVVFFIPVIIPEKLNATCHVYNMTVRVKEHSREAIKIHTTSQSPRDADIILRIATPPRVGRILRHGKMSYEFSVQDLEAGLIFYEHTGRETGLNGDMDHFNLTLLNDTEAWIREGRRYEGMKCFAEILIPDDFKPELFVIYLVQLQYSEKLLVEQDNLIHLDGGCNLKPSPYGTGNLG